MKDSISICELTAGLTALIDAILDTAAQEPSEAVTDRSTNIVDALRMVRARFEAMKLNASRDDCSAQAFEDGMNAIMAELRDRR